MTVFHLKYRPQTIAQLDSEAVRKTLAKLLENKDIPQVFLFAGPKGSGKTSAARIVAKAVNCLKPKNGDPCGKCSACLEITAGASVDVMELDGASNRGIDDIRLLKEKTFLLPASLKRKVFIIDEVHMLTKEAFNALLKILEEPPVHTIFILCTTDPEKIPETVLSRLIRIDFKKGKTKELRDSLQRVIAGEGIEVAEDVLKLVIDRSEGSFRNAQKLLTELVLACGKKITDEKVADLAWLADGNYSPELLAGDLVEGDEKAILQALEVMASAGSDMAEFRTRLVYFFQNKLLISCGIELEDQKKIGLSTEALMEWLQLLIAAGRQERDSVLSQLPLQLAVVEFLKGRKLTPVSTGVKNRKVEEEEKEKKENLSASEISHKKAIGSALVEVEAVEKVWGQILLAVKPYNHSIEAFLRAARPLRVEGETVVLEVFYPFHKDKLEEDKNRKIVEKVLKEVMGVELLMACVLGKLQRSTGPVIVPTENAVLNVVDKSKDGENGDMYQVAKEIFG